MENLYTPHSVRTISGAYVNFVDPDPKTFRRDDIAHALSMKPRWNGQLRTFYSVAQHCCLVCDYLPPEYKADGLMHDSPEAYMADVPSPLKALIPGYRIIEDRVYTAISARWGLSEIIPDKVKAVDREFLQKAWYGLMLKTHVFGHECWDQERAKQEFIFRFNRYVLKKMTRDSLRSRLKLNNPKP